MASENSGASNIIALTQSNYDEITSSRGKIVLVDFWAQWCGPCRAIAPILEKLAGEYADKLIVGKVNVDEQRELAAKYGIASIPTIRMYKDGAPAETLVGSRPYQEFKAAVERCI